MKLPHRNSRIRPNLLNLIGGRVHYQAHGINPFGELPNQGAGIFGLNSAGARRVKHQADGIDIGLNYRFNISRYA